MLSAILLALSLPFEGSPFGFHPASVPPDIGGGDPFGPAKEIGVRWHRPPVYAFWFLVQKTWEDYVEGRFRWEGLDRIVASVPRGINILWNLSARFYTRPGSFLPRDIEGFKRYVKEVVERYDGDGFKDAPGSPIVKYWQIENEPNLAWLWRKQGTPEEYAQLLLAAYEAAKEANPGCKVLIGGVGGGPGEGPDSSLYGFRHFYVPVLEALRGRGFDIFDYHWYGNARGDYKRFERVYREVRRALDKYGFEDAEIWVTEMSTYSGKPRGHPYQSEEEQAADLVKRYIFSLWLGVKKVFWAFGLAEGFKHDDGYFDHTGLIYDGLGSDDRGRGVRKLAFYAYKVMTQKLEGSDWDNVRRLQTGEGSVLAFEFKNPRAPKRRVIVVWWDWFEEPEVNVKRLTLDIGAEEALLTKALTDEAGNVKSWRRKAPGGRLSLELDISPLFVEPL